MTVLNKCAFNSRRLFLGALLGIVALSATPGKASAQIPPLEAISAIGNMVGIGQPRRPQERPNTNVLNNNLHSNDLDLCVLTCDLPSALLPPGRPPMPPQARPPMPPQARPPVPAQGQPPVSAPASRPQGPTILLPPIQL